mgnify:CR=1 FL=1
MNIVSQICTGILPCTHSCKAGKTAGGLMLFKPPTVLIRVIQLYEYSNIVEKQLVGLLCVTHQTFRTLSIGKRNTNEILGGLVASSI